jgi:phosphoribosylformylglycinamidine synthase PurS subunit
VVAPPVSTVTCHSFRGGLALGSPTPPHDLTIYALFALGGYVARVIVDVMLKPEIHDPQGEAVLSASHRLGFGGVTAVRQGKRFELEIDGPADSAALAAIEELARELLANPVIEEFTVSAG